MLDCRITSDLVLEQQDTCTLQAEGIKGKFRLEAVLENHTEDETALTIETELLDGGRVILRTPGRYAAKKVKQSI